MEMLPCVQRSEVVGWKVLSSIVVTLHFGMQLQRGLSFVSFKVVQIIELSVFQFITKFVTIFTVEGSNLT